MCHNLQRPRLQHLASQARYRLRIAISAYPTCIRRPIGGGGSSRRNIAMPFGTVKLEWCGYPMVKDFDGKNDVMSIFKVGDLSHLGF